MYLCSTFQNGITRPIHCYQNKQQLHFYSFRGSFFLFILNTVILLFCLSHRSAVNVANDQNKFSGTLHSDLFSSVWCCLRWLQFWLGAFILLHNALKSLHPVRLNVIISLGFHFAHWPIHAYCYLIFYIYSSAHFSRRPWDFSFLGICETSLQLTTKLRPF